MRKKLIAVCSALIVLTMALGGCGGNVKPRDVDVKLWSTNALDKVQRDDVRENVSSAALNYEMAKNEVEGAQFLITPQNGYKVNRFTVTTSALGDGNGNVIPTSDIKVYLQKYINVTNKMGFSPQLHAGYVPDALLPMEKAVEYGENTVEGVNQAVYVTVKTQKNTPAGVYTGSFTVDVDGAKSDIPVSVTVWNFAIPDENHVGSLFAIWQDELGYGELDATNDMYALYADFLADYRVSATNLISSYWETYSVEEYVLAARKATEDPRISTFALPYRSRYVEGFGGDVDYSYVKSYILGLLNACENAELLDKAVYYFGAMIDEPQYTDTFELAHHIFVETDKMEEEIIAEIERNGYFDGKTKEKVSEIKEKIRKLPNILTTSYTLTETKSKVDYDFGECTYCPLFNEFDGYNQVADEQNLSLYKRLKEVNGSVWWYGCNGPCYPYPCYHIDDNLLGARVLGTMMYDYGIDGNLYWCVNSYGNSNTLKAGEITRASDPYADAARNSPTWPTNGEGYLLYPGADYGIRGPIGSVRLEAIRDGNEDYEYYYLLGEHTDSLGEYYATEITTENMVSALYDRIYRGVKYVADNENFYAVRRELAGIIERIGEDDKFVQESVTYSGENATISFLVNSEYEVEANGTALVGTPQGAGKRYSFTIKMDKPSNSFEIKLKKGSVEKTVSVLAGGKTKIVSSFDDASSVSVLTANDQKITLTHNDNPAFSTSGGSLKAVIESKFDPNDKTATLTYNPRLTLPLATAGVNISSLDSLSFNIYNDSGIDVALRVRLVANGIYYTLSEITLKSGLNAVKIESVYQTNWSMLGSTSGIVLEFNNTLNNDNKEAMPVQTVYIDDLIVGEKLG